MFHSGQQQPGYCAGADRGDFTNAFPCYREKVEAEPLRDTRLSNTQLPGAEQRSSRLVSQAWSPEHLVAPVHPGQQRPGYCAGADRGDFTYVLACYREKVEAEPLRYTRLSDTQLPGVEQRSYRLVSQTWSPEHLVAPADWSHDVDIYIPSDAVAQRALVIVNNGLNHGDAGTQPMPPADFSTATLAALARATRTIVVSVSNVPNQYLMYQGDHVPRKEDDSVARSWMLFLDAPVARQTMPLHVPMVAAVSRAMTLASRELTQWQIERFIVSGASKRGWTSWLVAIADPRVDAIAPFAIDLLDTRTALAHMYRTYGGNWPIAFYPYYLAHVDERIDTADFARLLKIEDPLQYLGTNFEARLRIPKYILNASGDDFYAADNARFYASQLPGEKALRTVPNSDHHGILRVAVPSLTAFVNRIQRGASLPEIHPQLRTQPDAQILTTGFSEPPVQVTLWRADNPESRDFRYACGIRYNGTAVALTTPRAAEVRLPKPASGWSAAFVEATFRDGLVATTPVYISPDDRYPTTAPPASGAACRTLPGRGMGTPAARAAS